MKQPRTILAIRTSALGDVAMCIPVLYSVAKHYPDVEIKVLTQTAFARLFINAPANLSFVLVDWKQKHQGFGGFRLLLKELQLCSVDAVADLHNVLRSWLIDTFFLLQGTPVRMVNKGRRKRHELLRPDGRKTPQRNYVQRYADVFASLQLPIRPDFGSLFTPAEWSRADFPFRLPADGKRLIGIAPFARYRTKIYPLLLMERVVEQLSNQGFHLFLFGSRGEEEQQLETWERKYPRCTALPGKLTLYEELLLMAHLDVMLTMDSANMHLASLAGTPVVSVWGSTTPACGFLGWRQSEANAVYHHLPCQPCSISGRKQCPRHPEAQCLKAIAPEEICRKIATLNTSLKPQDK